MAKAKAPAKKRSTPNPAFASSMTRIMTSKGKAASKRTESPKKSVRTPKDAVQAKWYRKAKTPPVKKGMPTGDCCPNCAELLLKGVKHKCQEPEPTKAPKVKRSKRTPARKATGACPGCDGSGELPNGEPCAQCQPAAVAQAARMQQGRCIHEEQGMCPACMAQTVAQGSSEVATKQRKVVYQVYRDKNGIVYVRVALTKVGALYVVNKGFQVELVDMHASTARELYLQPVIGASVWEAAKRLAHPMNDQTTISLRAKTHLEQIINNEELKLMATTKKAAKATSKTVDKTPEPKTAKFATVTAPAAKKGGDRRTGEDRRAASAGDRRGSDATVTTKTAAKKTATPAANGLTRTPTYGDDQVIKAQVKENPFRSSLGERFQLILDGKVKTVADWKKHTDRYGDLRFFVSKNAITIK